MPCLRAINETGIEQFKNYIELLRDGSTDPPPIENLSSDAFSDEFEPRIEISGDSFSTRLDMGRYLQDCLNHVDRNIIVNLPGLWSWLSLFWFDQLCPEIDGRRRVRETARYICSMDYTDYYRHYVASSWDIYCLHGDYSRLFLVCPLYIHNDFIEQLASRQDIITIKGLIKAADALYWNEQRVSQKRNATNRNKPGNLRRLIAIVDQLSLTYDLHTMQADDILSLLPPEFDIWKNV